MTDILRDVMALMEPGKKTEARKLLDTGPGVSVLPSRKLPSGRRQHTILLAGVLLVAALGLLVYGYLSSTRCSRTPGLCPRILFIGNSYTYVNDLPGAFARLASAGGHEIETGMMAEGGWRLVDHAGSAGTLDKLQSSKWNFVVLQEQSQIPSVEVIRTKDMYPAARTLVGQIRAEGATPIFFLTWGHRQGWPDNGLGSYEDMQLQLNRGYLMIAQELNVSVVPVGYAWSLARQQNPPLDLWQEDGSHPSEQGTYLAACVFYAAIFRESPEGLSYTAHVPKDVAQVLQTIAADAVLKDPQQWYLP